MNEERYVNTPLPIAVYQALAFQASENGRSLGRELSMIAQKSLKRVASKLMSHQVCQTSNGKEG